MSKLDNKVEILGKSEFQSITFHPQIQVKNQKGKGSSNMVCIMILLQKCSFNLLVEPAFTSLADCCHVKPATGQFR